MSDYGLTASDVFETYLKLEQIRGDTPDTMRGTPIALDTLIGRSGMSPEQVNLFNWQEDEFMPNNRVALLQGTRLVGLLEL